MSNQGYSTKQVREYVFRVYDENGRNYTEAAKHLGVSAALVRKVILGKQQDSDLIRQKNNLPKPKRVRIVADVDERQRGVIDRQIADAGFSKRSDFFRAWGDGDIEVTIHDIETEQHVRIRRVTKKNAGGRFAALRKALVSTRG